MGKGDPSLGLYFKVSIDGQDIGSFASCKGLSFQVEVEEVVEGGNNAFVHQLPGRVKWGQVTFTRCVNSDSVKLAKWFASMDGGIKRTTASISLMSPDSKEEVAKWTLHGVIPVKWSGPDLDAESGKVAMETFEIAHHGFMGG